MRPRIVLDIGGEGRHPHALNVNPRRQKTLGPDRGAPILRLIVARADALPFATGSVAEVIVERTPLSNAAIAEIHRVIAPGGVVRLAHVALPDADRHARACTVLGEARSTRSGRIGGQCVQETRIVFPS